MWIRGTDMSTHRTFESIFNAMKIAALVLLGLLIANALVFGAEPHKDLTKYGVPDGSGILREKYLLGYDGRTRSARWVLERLDPTSLGKKVDRDTERFSPDDLAGEEFRSTAADYRASGFDIGHLVPADTHRLSQSDLDSTFLFSNATPQLPEFNRGLWKSLESEVREIGEASPVWVITAPMWVPEKGKLNIEAIGPHGVWIPSHCGKAVLIERKDEIELRAWIMPNRDLKGRKLDEFEVSIDAFETAAGFDCWSEIPDETEKKLEAGK